MNYRRYHVDRVNPRDVLPSRHTIFIRGLPGSTNVDGVKDYFSKETNSKCSIAFSSMSEDRIRFSVAVRFKTNELAREMLVKYNGKNLMGHPVEVTWFKDLRKARARINEDHRTGRFRPFRGFTRGPFKGPFDQRGRTFSNRSYIEPDHRRARHSSVSSEGGRPPRLSSRDGRRLPSASPSASSRSSSRSISRSRSRSSKRPRNEENLDNYHLPDQGVSHGKNMPQAGRSIRSRRSSSSSSSRSSSYDSCRRQRGSEGRVGDVYRNHPAPISFDSRSSLSPADVDSLPKKGRFEKVSDSGRSLPYTNVPAPNSENSGLLSGLIQLKRKPAGGLHARRRHSRSHSQSPVSSSSDTSSHVPKEPRKTFARGKFSPSPPNFNEDKRLEGKDSVRQTSSPSRLPADECEGRVSRLSADGNRWRPVDYPEDHHGERRSNFGRPVNGNDSVDENSADANRDRSQEPKLPSPDKWPRRLTPSPKKIATSPADSVRTKRASESERNLVAVPPSGPIKTTKDKRVLIQERKATIEEEYKRDCETFATVVRTLIRYVTDQRSSPLSSLSPSTFFARSHLTLI
uniref:RRM domain-containing protein n=1 Tax=Schistocephalus solidus TaxID=70667 RepID=A0A0X3NIL9_SCHSO